MTVAFNPQVHERYMSTGTATIEGHAVLKKQNGEVVTCAGEPVMLLPNTDYFAEAISIVRKGGKPETGKIDPKYRSMLHQTTCDATGNFKIEALPAGEWNVLTRVVWFSCDRPWCRQGGELIKTVTTKANTTERVILAGSDFAQPNAMPWAR